MKSVGRCRMRRSLALLVTCVLAGTGCQDSGATADPTISLPQTTLPPGTTASTTPTTTLIPLDQDPPVIDLAYAQRVLDEISRLEGEASRILYRDKAVTPEYEELLQSFLYGPALEDAQAAARDDLSNGFRHYRDPPGDPLVTARRLLSSRTGCIALMADSDLGPRFRANVEVQKNIGIVLQRNKRPTEVEHRLNPTDWFETGGGEIAPGRDLSEFCR
jgi:hypothetical protein